MDAKNLGLFLLAIYSYLTNNPVKRVGAILQSFDPSYGAYYYDTPDLSKWRARLQLGIYNGAQITILALILKLTRLLNYPFSDGAWIIFGITLVVLMTAANMYTNKYFYTNELEGSNTPTASYLFDLLISLAKDIGDLLIVGLLIVSTVRQSMFKDWMPTALLIFLAVALVAVMTNELFKPDFLQASHEDHQYRQSFDYYPWQWKKCSHGEREECVDDGYVSSLYDWFTNNENEYKNSTHGFNDAMYVHNSHVTSRFVSKIVLTVAVILLAGKSI